MIKGRDLSQGLNPSTPYCSSSVESILLKHFSSSPLKKMLRDVEIIRGFNF